MTTTFIPPAVPALPATPPSMSPTMHLGTTGFVSSGAGSVASANLVVLQELLDRGNRVTFYSKPHFVDPRPHLKDASRRDRFEFINCQNGLSDHLKRLSERVPLLSRGLVARGLGILDGVSYGRRIVSRMSEQRPRVGIATDLSLWLGTWARGRVPGLPTVSWAQGPPGTDARSVARHAEEIRRLGGRVLLLKLRAYAAWRAGVGLPQFDQSDHVIVGSEWSRQDLQNQHDIEGSKVHALPYPIDLDLFRPPDQPRSTDGPLRVMWLGRFVPRKRLPLFLNGLAEAIQQGIDVRVTVIGNSGFVPNYERFLEAFPYRERLTHVPSVPRTEVPTLMAQHDLLIQPSDNENFGSSVAEAQACGMPVIVGATNGTSDYICDRSIRLTDDRTKTLAAAIATFAEQKRAGSLADGQACRAAAERHCHPSRVVARLEEILRLAINEGTPP